VDCDRVSFRIFVVDVVLGFIIHFGLVDPGFAFEVFFGCSFTLLDSFVTNYYKTA